MSKKIKKNYKIPIAESPLDCRQIHPKGDQSWVFTGRIDAEAETPVLGAPDAKS